MDRKPTYIMDLPQLPDEEEALSNWTVMIRKLQKFLEATFKVQATDEQIEAAIKDTNRKNAMMRKVIGFAALRPPFVGWQEMYDLTFLSQGSTGKEMESVLSEAVRKLEERKIAGYVYGPDGAPRVLVTGCPVGGGCPEGFQHHRRGRRRNCRP